MHHRKQAASLSQLPDLIYLPYPNLLNRPQTPNAAGAADSKRAAITHNVGTTVRDARQFRRAQRCFQEWSLCYSERSSNRCPVDGCSICQHSTSKREACATSQRRTVRATCAREARTRCCVHQFHHYRIGPYTRQRIADQITVDRE